MRTPHRPTRFFRVCLAVIVFIVAASSAAAQPSFRPYVGGSFGSFSISADEVEGTSAVPGVLAGIAVSRLVDVEVEFLFPTDIFARSHTGPSTSFAPLGSTRAEIERLAVITRVDWRREVTNNFSVVAIVRPPLTSRVVPGLIAGVTNQRARNRTIRTPVTIPPGVDPLHPRVAATDETVIRNLGAPTIGVNFSIAVSPQLYIVPDIRYDYGSIGDEINNALRTSIRTVWRF